MPRSLSWLSLKLDRSPSPHSPPLSCATVLPTSSILFHFTMSPPPLMISHFSMWPDESRGGLPEDEWSADVGGERLASKHFTSINACACTHTHLHVTPTHTHRCTHTHTHTHPALKVILLCWPVVPQHGLKGSPGSVFCVCASSQLAGSKCIARWQLSQWEGNVVSHREITCQKTFPHFNFNQ